MATGTFTHTVIAQENVDNVLKTSQVTRQAGSYPGVRSMRRLGVFLLPPGWDASSSQGYHQH